MVINSMEKVVLNTAGAVSNILIGESVYNLAKYIPANQKTIIITDDNIAKLYAKAIEGFDVIVIPQGENNKTLATIDLIMGKLVEFEADRSTFIVGIGGGIVSDITGFAASIYMRGLNFGFVTTSLLSMVDASVGGKNGVNYGGFKNMVGVFNQPQFVICDIEMLKTLDREEFIGGMAEVIKHGAIKDKALFEFLENNYNAILKYDKDAIHRCIKDSVEIKANVVSQDEREKGERRKLNFGHTFGHAIEKLTMMPHGKAVAIGMNMAAAASVLLGHLSQNEALRLKKLTENFLLPTYLDADSNALFNAMKKDKKRDGASLHLVLLDSIGHAIIENVEYKKLEEIIHDMRLA